MTAPNPTTPTTPSAQALLDVVTKDHLDDWVELVQLRAVVAQQSAALEEANKRIAELEQSIRDMPPPAAGGDG